MKDNEIFECETFNGEAEKDPYVNIAIIDGEEVSFNLSFTDKPVVVAPGKLYEYIGEGILHTWRGQRQAMKVTMHFYRRTTPSSE